MTRDEIKQRLGEENPQALLADDLDDALVGIGYRCGQPALAVYDCEKIIDVLVARDGMTREEAAEFMDFNITGAWVGEHTPIFLYR
jgi:hypothetical protein